ncbi:hypothetical protein GCM10010440_41320 [Kitasatospora cinereorecta]
MTSVHLRAIRLPSGWSPLELVKHLAHMERRRLRWGFLAEQLPEHLDAVRELIDGTTGE